MATAAELLAARTSGASGVSDDKTLIIDNYLRAIQIPPSITTLGVENDDDVLRLRFRMPRYLGTTDLSTFSIRINYLNSSGESDVYTVSDAAIVGDNITFSWLVGPTATRYKGKTKFNVCMRIVDAEFVVQKEYNTAIATLPVLEGLECDESSIEAYSDILEQWKSQLFGIGDTLEAQLTKKSEEEQQKIADKGIGVLATIPENFVITHKLANEAARTKGDAITCYSEGVDIKLVDSSDDYIRGLSIYGKSTQDATTGRQLFNHRTIGANLYTTISPDGTILVECDNREGTSGKFATFYTPVTSLLKPNTTYAMVLEVFSTSGVGESVYLASHHTGEPSQFADTPSVTSIKPGTYVKLAKTNESFDTSKYMCRGFMSIPAGTNVRSVIRVSVLEDTTVTADNFVYETYSGGFASPSPAWQQMISAIEQPTVTVYGKNLFNLVGSTKTHNGVTYTINDDGTVTASGTASMLSYIDYVDTLAKGSYHFSGCPVGGDTVNGYFIRLLANGEIVFDDGGLGFDFELTEDAQIIVRLVARDGTAMDNVVFSPMICFADTEDKTYELGLPRQTLTAPYILNSVPTNQNGNYTDENGQQWICDEVDFERGVFIQRIKWVTLDGANLTPYPGTHSNGQAYCAIYPGDVLSSNRVLSTAYVSPLANWSNEDGYIYCINKSIVITDSRFTTANEAASIFAEEHTTILYALETPIETELPASMMNVFGNSRTNFLHTVIRNDRGAVMRVKYNADTKTYMDASFWKHTTTPSDEQVQAAVDAWLTKYFSNAEGVSF